MLSFGFRGVRFRWLRRDRGSLKSGLISSLAKPRISSPTLPSQNFSENLTLPVSFL
jgi:hypothetical protein